MVTWSDDVNMDHICDGLNKYISRYKMKTYHIFGLQQEDRPHVRISPVCPDVLKELFERSDYTLEVRAVNERYCGNCDATHTPGDCCCDEGDCEMCNPNTITIGLRRDIRRNTEVARKLIKTILFAIEGKLVLDKKAKLSLGSKVKKSPKNKQEPVTPKKKKKSVSQLTMEFDEFVRTGRAPAFLDDLANAIVRPNAPEPLPPFITTKENN